MKDEKIILANEKTDGLKRVDNSLNAWSKFKTLYRAKPSINRPNVTMLLFFVPLLLILLYSDALNSAINLIIPFGSRLATGFPLDLHAASSAKTVVENNTKLILFLCVGGIAIFSFSLAGALKVIRNGLLTLEINQRRDFFRGIKENWAACLYVCLFWLLLSNGLFYLFIFVEDAIASALAVLIIKILSIAVLCLFIIFGFHMMCLSASYEQRFFKILKNSFYMTFNYLLPNIFMLVLTALPAVLMAVVGNQLFSIVVLMFYAMVGFSATVFLWMNLSIRLSDNYPKYATVNKKNK
jgi:hypothetical protein